LIQLGNPAALARIEELIRELTGGPGSYDDLMREHLEEARFYLLGCMPLEYKVTLEIARETLPAIENRDLRERIGEFLRVQQ
jgi:hypothetical protein